jgi:hypothetical protein
MTPNRHGGDLLCQVCERGVVLAAAATLSPHRASRRLAGVWPNVVIDVGHSPAASQCLGPARSAWLQIFNRDAQAYHRIFIGALRGRRFARHPSPRPAGTAGCRNRYMVGLRRDTVAALAFRPRSDGSGSSTYVEIAAQGSGCPLE